MLGNGAQEIARVQNAASAAAQGGGTMGLRYDVQAITAQADQKAQELMSMDPASKQSQLDYLSQSDPVMYACVKEALANYDQSAVQQATQQVRAQGGPAPVDPSMGGAPAPAGAPPMM